MKVSVTLVSENDLIRALVGEFAHGLGCPVAAATPPDTRIRIDINDDAHSLVELLTHVAQRRAGGLTSPNSVSAPPHKSARQLPISRYRDAVSAREETPSAFVHSALSSTATVMASTVPRK